MSGCRYSALPSKVHFRIEADEIACARHHKRVDLQQARILLQQHLVERADELDALLDRISFKPQRKRDLAAVKAGIAGCRVDGHGEDFLRRLRRHFLDIHAALGRGYEGDARGGAVDQRGEIELAVNVAPVFHIDAPDFLALGAGLMGHQRHAEHALGFLAHLVDGLDHLDATALAAAASVDLRLDDPDRSAEFLGGAHRVFRRKGYRSPRNRHAELLQNRLRLVFVNVHGRFGVLADPAASTCFLPATRPLL